MVQLVIFDLDGTLINSVEDLRDATNYALNKNGYPEHEIDKYYYFVGNGILKLIERAVPENTDKNMVQKVLSDFSQYYGKHYADKTKPYQGISELIDTIKKSNVKIAVASNKADNFAKTIIKDIFGDVFDYVIGQQDNIPKKPEPDMINMIMNSLKVNQADTVMVGDTNVDILTAKNSCIKSVGCLWGFRTRKELEDAGADFIIAHPQELLYIVNREGN